MTTVIDKKIINVSVNEPTPDLPPPERKKRPAILNGQTAKIQVGGSPTDQFNCYLTLNCLDTNVPFEVLLVMS